MRTLLVLALALGLDDLSGCCNPIRWGFADLTVRGDPQFAALVSEAVDAWDAALYTACHCPVLRVVDAGGRPIVEVSARMWDGGSSTIGYFDGSKVAVVMGDHETELAVLVHELGHAIGLDHVDPADDPQSTMHPHVSSHRPYPDLRDAKMAAEVLGCRVVGD